MSRKDELKYVTLPSTLEFIGESAFADTSISFVTLPKNLRDFNGTIFNSQSFTQYSVSPENPYYKAIDGVVYSKDLTKLVAYTGVRLLIRLLQIQAAKWDFPVPTFP